MNATWSLRCGLEEYGSVGLRSIWLCRRVSDARNHCRYCCWCVCCFSCLDSCPIQSVWGTYFVYTIHVVWGTYTVQPVWTYVHRLGPKRVICIVSYKVITFAFLLVCLLCYFFLFLLSFLGHFFLSSLGLVFDLELVGWWFCYFLASVFYFGFVLGGV